ncbi:MAG: class I SAM-dependent methyltransferase [Lachnospiraceae bacterium]|nr:class I SAM-dependent methyltransferase [Lachnospiraceae bacterium]
MNKIIRINNDNIPLVKKAVMVQKKLDSIDIRNRVLFFGGGIHTQCLFAYCCLPDFRYRICDSYVVGSINEIEIEKTSREILDWADVVIVSSFYKRKEIIAFISEMVDIKEKKIISLYDDNDTCPFFEVEINLDPNKIAGLLTKDVHIKDESKYNGWKDAASGTIYETKVEKYFFDVVTKYYYLDYVRQGDKVLDIGAGTGRLSIACYDKGAKVTAVDTSESMLDVLLQKASEIETVIVQDEKLPFSDDSFDVVVSCDAMIHFMDWEKFFEEHVRVLKRGGYIVYNMYNAEHLKRISEDRILAASYIAGGVGKWYSTITETELVHACEEVGGVRLEKMIPVDFLYQNAIWKDYLTREEMFALGHAEHAACKDKVMADVLHRFEREIIATLPAKYAAQNICVFKKE